MRIRVSGRLLSVLLGLVIFGAGAQTPPPPAPSASAPTSPARPVPPNITVPDPSEPKPFDKVITAEAKTQEGLFRVHTLKNKLYFEIPKALLEQPLLMVVNATAVPSGQEHVGRTLNQDVLRLVLKNHRVMLQLMSHDAVSEPGNTLAEALKQSQRDAILTVFPVEAYGKDGAPVIEVTRLFSAEIGDFSARSMLRGGLDGSRSYVEQTKAFPSSVRVDAVHTYTIAPTPVLIPGLPIVAPTTAPRSASLNLAYSIVQLPKEPMRPRLMDDRVGYLSIARNNFGSGLQEVQRERLITRWRLEKKDPAAAVSEPVRPIVWYIDKATPAELVPYVKKGVEAWNAAFEAAGFRNAVQARTYPTKDEDPDFDPEDVRYSVIRWVPSPIPNAYGPHLADPRSGEILNANVVLFHNILQLQRDWYVTQVGPLDPRARRLPLPDDLMGELMSFVVTHEIGHSLGLPHNMKSSSLYPVEKLRDPAWLKTMGHVPSIMDYSRFNYVAQPEDKIDPALLIPKLGPYDVFAIQWGYTPIPSAQTPAEERTQLNLWARQQDSQPWLRFSAPKAEGGDAGENQEAVGDADAVTASTLGQRNLQRVMKMLPGLLPEDGKDDRGLMDLYGAVWTQWFQESVHVASVIGGYLVQNKHNDQPGEIATPVPRAQQQRAMKFFTEQILATPAWLLDPAVTQRLGASTAPGVQSLFQRVMLLVLLDPARTRRLLAQEAQLGREAYRLEDMLLELRRSVFLDLGAAGAISAPRRSLQRHYVDILAARLALRGVALLDDGQAQIRQEMRELKSLLASKALGGDLTRRAHVLALVDTLDKALDPRAAPSASASTTVVRAAGIQAQGHVHDAHCWHGRSFLTGVPAIANWGGWAD